MNETLNELINRQIQADMGRWGVKVKDLASEALTISQIEARLYLGRKWRAEELDRIAPQLRHEGAGQLIIAATTAAQAVVNGTDAA